MVIEFQPLDDHDLKAEVPDPEFLRVHAAFGRVVRACGAAEYMDKLESLADDDDIGFTPNDISRFTSVLSAKLELSTY
jgi:hypothetical protein